MLEGSYGTVKVYDSDKGMYRVLFDNNGPYVQAHALKGSGKRIYPVNTKVLCVNVSQNSTFPGGGPNFPAMWVIIGEVGTPKSKPEGFPTELEAITAQRNEFVGALSNSDMSATPNFRGSDYPLDENDIEMGSDDTGASLKLITLNKAGALLAKANEICFWFLEGIRNIFFLVCKKLSIRAFGVDIHTEYSEDNKTTALDITVQSKLDLVSQATDPPEFKLVTGTLNVPPEIKQALNSATGFLTNLLSSPVSAAVSYVVKTAIVAAADEIVKQIALPGTVVKTGDVYNLIFKNAWFTLYKSDSWQLVCEKFEISVNGSAWRFMSGSLGLTIISTSDSVIIFHPTGLVIVSLKQINTITAENTITSLTSLTMTAPLITLLAGTSSVVISPAGIHMVSAIPGTITANGTPLG